jgi:site-specific DNA-methyltransferase (cytosine-N4-specific)
MIPQIARRLINEYRDNHTKLLFDPYCGTGTSLLEANLCGINAIGTDLNPLARLIAKSKTTKYDFKLIDDYMNYINSEVIKFCAFKNYSNDLFSPNFDEVDTDYFESIKIPNFHNINFWFSYDTKVKLSFIKYLIDEKVDDVQRDFFLVAFSETVRESSYTRNSEFKLYRIPKSKIKDYNPEPFEIFQRKVKRNLLGLKEFIEEFDGNVLSQIYDFNTCEQIPSNIFDNKDIDLIVTSPPYGDSRTTVAYGQFSRLSNQWLGFKNAHKVDASLMGGNGSYKNGYINFESANRELTQLKESDITRYNDVQSFLIDYYNSIKNISLLVRKDAHVCYVLGNRTVKNIQIPLDLITTEIFGNFGFEHIRTQIRNIPNKRMPKLNSPSNIPGETASTMNNEYIVIMKKI